MTQLRILNLGAGVQSTTLALMAHNGEIPKYDYAIFADVQAEPKAVYTHLQWLVSHVSFPVLVRSRGSLIDNLRAGVDGDGRRYCSIPTFTGEYGKPLGITRRQCTSEYKIKVVEKTIRREIFGLRPGQHFPKSANLTQSFGLSYDEQSRIFKVQRNHQRNGWKLEFPLFDMEMNRSDCVEWLKNYGIPHEVPRSACTFCPYHSNAEWQRIKSEDPESWAQAVEVDKILRNQHMRAGQGFRDQLWLHRSCKPLDEIDFTVDSRVAKGQQSLGFDMECEGMCGV